jgi:glycosyltransferase involved in cell wall biosynthesis
MVKVSICITCYNQADFLDECLASALDQQVDFSIEVIICDDASTDSTSKILSRYLEKFPEIVKVHRHSKNIGAIKNFVYSHNQAQGEYVCHLDGDDLWKPGKLREQVEFLDKNADYTVCWTRSFLKVGDELITPNDDQSNLIFPCGEVTLESSILYGYPACHSSIMYRRAARQTTNPTFDTIDLFYAWEFLLSGKGKVLDSRLIIYRTSLSTSLSTGSQQLVKSCMAHHALYFLELVPQFKSQIFLFTLGNFVADIKNRRPSFKLFIAPLLKSFTFLSPIRIVNHLLTLAKLNYKKQL